MDLIALTVFVVVLGAVLAVYILGVEEGRALRSARREIRDYRPPIEVVMEYRNPHGTASRWRLDIISAYYTRGGKLCFIGRAPNARRRKRFLTFRFDRVTWFATTDGEVIDTQAFLTQKLGITPPNPPPTGTRR